MKKTNRIALFVHYDHNNLIDDYVVSYVKALKTVAQDIYFISNCEPNQSEQDKVRGYTKEIILRENRGCDFGAWKEVILHLGLASLAAHYNELILANDSCYAPFFPFKEMFDMMSVKKYDLWGVTENKSLFFTSEDQEVAIPEHLQSYFLVFSSAVLQSVCFADFWHNIDVGVSRDRAILTSEVVLTELLKKNNFRCGAYLPCQAHDFEVIKKKYRHQCYDLSIFYWYVLLERGNPFLKVKAIPLTLRRNKKWLKSFSRQRPKSQDFCSFHQVDKHLKRISMRYRFERLNFLMKFFLFFSFILHPRSESNFFSLYFKKCVAKSKSFLKIY